MSISSTSLRIDVEEQERWRRTVSVTVPAEVVRKERAAVVKKLASRIRLPGFRQGKVPPAVVEKQYGPELQKETIDRVIGEAYRTAIAERSLQPISQGEVENVDYQPEADLTFKVSFDVRPSIEIPRVGGFKVTRARVEITPEQVDLVVARLLDQKAMWRPVEDGGKAQEGELVTVRITALDAEGKPEGEGQGYQIVVGEGDAIPDVENAILKLAPGTGGDFTVRFPMDNPDPAKRGLEQRVHVDLVDRRVKETPALDDEFARSLGDFDSVDTLKAKIRSDMEAEARGEVEASVNAQLVDRIVEANPFEVPNSMVVRYIESMLGDVSKADPDAVARAREELRPQAERAVKRILVIDHVADAQSLNATPEEFDARLAEIADANRTTPAKVKANLVKAHRVEQLERELTERKVLEYLRAQSEIQDES